MEGRISRTCCSIFLVAALAVACAAATTGQPPARAPAAAMTPHASQATVPVPAQSGPPNITAILEKGGHFCSFIRLMLSTQGATQINNQLNDSNYRMTILAPTDAAFSALSPGFLNGLGEAEKSSLLQFHVIPSYISFTRLHSMANPVKTQAGGVGKYEYPLNLTATADGSVAISTGIDNATMSGTVYSDDQLAVYQVDKVLLPLAIFGPKPPTPSPAPSPVPAKSSPGAINVRPAPPSVPVDASGEVGTRRGSAVTATFVAAALGLLWG